jgi:hypothetical protein
MFNVLERNVIFSLGHRPSLKLGNEPCLYPPRLKLGQVEVFSFTKIPIKKEKHMLPLTTLDIGYHKA